MDSRVGADFIPLGAEKAFDSHICFGSKPIVMEDGSSRFYYMGGDGPHFGLRKSSLGLATLPPDRFASLTAAEGQGPVLVNTSESVLVTGPVLIVTADFVESSAVGSIRIGVAEGSDALSLENSIPLTKKLLLKHSRQAKEGTNVQMTFRNGKNFRELVGKSVKLALELNDVSLYTLGFTGGESDKDGGA